MPPFLNPSATGRVLTYATAFFGAFLAALWVSLIIWTLRDIRRRTEDRALQALAAVLVAVLNLPGLVVYFILRPSETIEEAYIKALEEEALLAQVESTSQCPGCGASVKGDWQVCPQCHTKLRKACASCGHLLELPWQVCPYCGTPTPSHLQDEGAPALNHIAR